MSYYSIFTGDFQIQPPLPWSAVRDSKFLAARTKNSSLEVAYEIEETTEDTDEGVVIRKRAVAVVPTWKDSYSARYLEEQLRQIAAEVGAAGARLRGHLVREGEAQGDVERYFQDDTGHIVSETATLTWPDGTKVDV